MPTIRTVTTEPRDTRAGRKKTGDRGQTVLEYVGVVPLLIVIGLLVVQLGLAAFAVQQAGTASRAAARMASYDHPDRSYQQAGRDAMSDSLVEGTTFESKRGYGEVTVTAKVPVPSLIPGLLNGVKASRSATMPVDDH
ncbi:pilus assembly protein [Streptomyces sp. RY43-2]|uniref:Pilus assembly protein n=1 Tax=Streptomyces macrolidinus TaxID=2952607 RepID=A0ABT0ZLJ8_9ACTN|nr:TadE family protein [Streptomyces macrolidinus]MCN9244465.1 pilus assembly protein [Streptomyces macrolidinus]